MKKRIPFIFVLLFVMYSKLYGKIVVLNGPSGSGKSSIQREFQKLMMPELWVKVGVDNLFDFAMPDVTTDNMHLWQAPNPIRWVEQSFDENGNNVITLKIGQDGKKIVSAMSDAIVAYAKNGCNVIVDYIAYEHDWLSDLAEKLSRFEVYFIAVKIPLELLEEREAARGTSPKGHARSHYDMVYGDIHYDLTVDSGENTSKEIAQEIRDTFK